MYQSDESEIMLDLHIPDMSCGHCRKAIESAVRGVDPSATLDFDMEARRASVDTRTEQTEVIKALAKAGYPATPVQQ
jgi:copper chaperone